MNPEFDIPERITLDGRVFSLSEGKNSPPQGNYVAYKGKYYSVSAKKGYPLSVVAEIAAEHANQLVLVPANGVLAFISGEGRVSHIPSKVSNGSQGSVDGLYRSFLRLTLLSGSNEVLALGDIDELAKTPLKRIDTSKLSLPPVIRRSKSWLMLALLLSTAMVGFAGSYVIKSRAKAKDASLASRIEKSEQELTALMKDVREVKDKVKSMIKPAEIPVGIEALPEQSQSYYSTFAEGKTPVTNVVRVTNGKFQY